MGLLKKIVEWCPEMVGGQAIDPPPLVWWDCQQRTRNEYHARPVVLRYLDELEPHRKFARADQWV